MNTMARHTSTHTYPRNLRSGKEPTDGEKSWNAKLTPPFRRDLGMHRKHHYFIKLLKTEQTGLLRLQWETVSEKHIAM